jgi:enoyl-CoA hydratase/carnithine racemase
MHAPAPNEQLSAVPVVLRQDAERIAVLTLNRPQRRNSLSEEMLAALTSNLINIASDGTVRAVVLAASGPVFCAGHDLKELIAHRDDADRGQSYFEHVMELCSGLMQTIVGLPQPVIAAVQGTATAAGCQLVATCDLAIASRVAKFCTPGVDIGLFCSTPMVALSRNIAGKHAMEMLLTGEMITAERAERIGLVNRVVSTGTEHEEAMQLARQIAAKSKLTVKTGKRAFYRQREMTLVDAYRYASHVMVENMLAHDAQEGICAFIAKRPPKWMDC